MYNTKYLSESTVGISDTYESVSGVNVFPNPSDGKFTIIVAKNEGSTALKEIKVMDMVGRVVWENKTPTGHPFNIDISAYAQGVYCVRAVNELGEIEIKKLVKQ